MRDLIQKPATASDRGLRAMVALCTTILFIAALYLARPVFAPLAFALLIIAIVWPMQSRLQQYLPRLLALAISILATILLVTAFGSAMSWGFSRVGRYLISDAARFQVLYGQASAWLEGHGIVIASLWAEHFNVGWLIRLFQQIAARLNDLLSFLVVVLIYVILGLLEVETAGRKLRELPDREFANLLLTAGARTTAKLRRYMLVRTLMSAATGILVWGFTSLCGLPLAPEWGVIAFALNYIPFIGPLIATILPTLFAIAQFQAWQAAVFVFGCLNVIQFLAGSYLEPRMAGSFLSISPFLVLFAVFFWTFIWGIAGAFIGVPIAIAVLTVCDQFEPSRWLAKLLGGSANAHTWPTVEPATPASRALTAEAEPGGGDR